MEQVLQQDIWHLEQQLATVHRQQEGINRIRDQHLRELHILSDTFRGAHAAAAEGQEELDRGDESDRDSSFGSFSHLTTAVLPPPQRDPITGEIPDWRVFLNLIQIVF